MKGREKERHEVSSFMEVIRVVFLSIIPYSHSLAFIPKVKLDTKGFVMGLQLWRMRRQTRRCRKTRLLCFPPGVVALLLYLL